ncbi:putative UDP-N-acetylglucosamine--dolichyl-phosphate N-acetylglucosaminephosphotransferase [Clavispora lusitaniae]|uniref:UDP-N-acetylglucosamine--dolichyl-phosphate N-acetylglucosaminephosphotransferase n=1 Tax=Clavispora lusitaniae TaxID=36911 RepID=A0AA91PW30_CLALS|nr:putative UDP-N-acetylglucosamine--dolichyl-phosphate N-acetylglucosaminephosphotransferase [Clavispora lusitaniae]
MRLLEVSALVAALALARANSPLQTAVAFGLIGFSATSHLVPRLGASFLRVGLSGRDLSKKPPVAPIPESMGVVPAVTYMVLLVTIIPFVFFKYLVSFQALSDDSDISAVYENQYHAVQHNNNMFPHNKLAEFLSGALCLLSTVLLGFFDDLFDIRWRHKFFLPAVASLPLLIVYYVDFSVTSIVVPPFVSRVPGGDAAVDMLRILINAVNRAVSAVTGLRFTTLATDYVSSEQPPQLLDLGVCYYAYMSALSIFAPNSINILAGINGLEVGQSIVLGVIFLLNDLCYLLSASSPAAHDSHLLSAIFVIPFLGVSAGLWQYNWYPAQVFVGDTYCYFSGMVFAVVGILGHFSKTLLIFLLPQIINFLYSVPQLFHIVPCPRHRMPKFNVDDGLMYPSFGELKQATAVGTALVSVLAKCGLIQVRRNSDNQITHFSNMTIINLALVWLGPMREDRLCLVILAFQLVVGLSMIVVRHTVGPWLFGYDNLSWGVK